MWCDDVSRIEPTSAMHSPGVRVRLTLGRLAVRSIPPTTGLERIRAGWTGVHL